MSNPNRRSRENMLMRVAFVFAERATCSRLQVGALIHREGRILSTGYNGAPKGMEHCNHKQSDSACLKSTHAEANAITFAARHGTAIEGAELYTTHSPCMGCAHLIINSGLVHVSYALEYRDTTPIEFLKEAGVSTAWQPLSQS